MEIIVKTFQGLEDVLAKEVEALGGTSVQKLKRAVSCEGDKALVYKLNFHLRTGLRVLIPIHKWKALNYTEIYEEARKIPWEDYMDLNTTFAIKANSFSTYFKNTLYGLQRIKDAIADTFREKTGSRPSVDKTDPDIWFNLHIYEDDIQLLIDTSGAPLYQRGFQKTRGIAPINEVLAAGILAMSGWESGQNFYDPMCGSGTFLLEAASKAANMPSQWHREHFHFMNARDYDEKLWQEIIDEPEPMDTESKFYASDIDRDAIDFTHQNLTNLDIEHGSHIWKADFFKIFLGAKPGWLFMNPPYNERLTLDQSIGWHMNLGKVLRERYGGWKVCIMSGDQEALKHIGFKPDRKIELLNGAIPIKVYFISIFDR